MHRSHQQNGKIVSGFLWSLRFSGFPETSEPGNLRFLSVFQVSVAYRFVSLSEVSTKRDISFQVPSFQVFSGFLG